jgi:hypothetical protein
MTRLRGENNHEIYDNGAHGTRARKAYRAPERCLSPCGLSHFGRCKPISWPTTIRGKTMTARIFFANLFFSFLLFSLLLFPLLLAVAFAA